MTKKEKEWRPKIKTEFLILQNLAVKGSMFSVDFEDSEKVDDPIPHASLAKVLRELQDECLIKKTESDRRAKRHDLKVPCFKITLLGLIKFFSQIRDMKINISERYVSSVMRSSSVTDLLPWFATNWDFLTSLYETIDMFKLLVTISKTIEIIDRGDEASATSSNGSRTTVLMCGLSDDEKEVQNAIGFRDINMHILNALEFWFVRGLVVQGRERQGEYSPIVLMKKSTSKKELLAFIRGSSVGSTYASYLRFLIKEEEKKINKLKDLLANVDN